MMLIDSIGVGIILPILPQLFFNPDLSLIIGNPEHRAFLYSLTLAVYPMTRFFGMSFFGRMSDNYGRYKLLLIGVGIFIITYSTAMLAITIHSFWLFILARSFNGFLSGIYSVGNALVSDISGNDSEERLLNFRWPSLGEKLGFTIGPSLSIFVVANAYFSNELAIPYFLATILASINFLVLFFTFRRSPQIGTTNNYSPIKWIQLFDATSAVIRKRKTRFLVLSFLFAQFSVSLFSQALSLYLTIQFNYTPAQVGIFSTVMSICLVVSLYGLTPWLKSYSSASLVTLMLGILGILFGLICSRIELGIRLFPESVVPIWIISVIFFFTQPIIRLLFTTLFSESASLSEQGLIMGAAGQTSALGYAFSSLFVGHIVLSHLVMCICSLSFIVAALMLQFHSRQQNPLCSSEAVVKSNKKYK